MKKYLILLHLVLFSTYINGQQDLFWDYPVKPGSLDWKKLYNQKLKVEACQIPVEILKNISTNRLIDLYFDYPLLINITVFSTFQIGMEDIKTNFNGLRELYSRNNAPKLLVDRYINMSLVNLDQNWSTIQKGQFAFKVLSLELIISQKEILKELTSDEKKILLLNTVNKFQDKKDLLQIYDYISLKSTSYLLTELILDKDLFNPSISLAEALELNNYSNSTSIYNKNMLLRIIELANILISKL